MAGASARILVTGRWGFMVLSMLLLLVLLDGAQKFKIESDYKIFFKDDNPQLTAYEFITDTFTQSDGIGFYVKHKDNPIFSPEMLDLLERMTEAAWEMPYSRRVSSITNYQHTFVDGDELIVQPLVEDALNMPLEEIKEAEKIALSSNELVHGILSEDGKVTVVGVTLNMPENVDEQSFVAKEILQLSRKMAKEWMEEVPGTEIHLMGVTAYNGTFLELTERDAVTLVPAMYLLISVLLLVLLRSFVAMSATLLLITASIIGTAGLTGWMGIAMNQVSISAPSIIMTLAVCDSVHMFNRFKFYLNQGHEKRQALELAIQNNMRPIILTSVTTAIGFLSMNFSDSPPFRDLGTLTAFGVMLACFLTFTLLPWIMMLLPFKSKQQTARLQTLAAWCAETSIKHHKKLLISAFPLALFLAAFLFKNELNDDAIGYFDESVEFRQAAEFMKAHLPGFDTMEYAIDSGVEGGAYEPEFLAKVQDFLAWYQEQPEVVHVGAYTKTLKRLNKNMNNDDESFYTLPESRELASQYTLLYELSLPYGLDLNNTVNLEKSTLRLFIKIYDQNSSDLIALEQRAQAWLDENAPELKVHGSSVPLMFAYYGLDNIRNMLNGSLFAVLFVALSIALAMRSLNFGLLSLIPNAFPAAIAFGIWGIVVGEVNVAVSVIFAVTLGIVVDDTVHFISKFQDAKQKGFNSENAIRYAFESVGGALMITTMVLSCGFLVLALSNFNVSAYTGLMVAMTIIIALAFDFFVLPAILLVTNKDTEELKSQPAYKMNDLSDSQQAVSISDSVEPQPEITKQASNL